MPSVKLDRHSKITSNSSLVVPIDGTGADTHGGAWSVGNWICVDGTGFARWAATTISPQPSIGVVYKIWSNFLVVLTAGEIIVPGWNKTPGAEYFLDANGEMTTTPPTANGTIVQSLGVAIKQETFIININDYLEN